MCNPNSTFWIRHLDLDPCICVRFVHTILKREWECVWASGRERERERERESFWWKDRETCFHFCLAFSDLSCMCAHICNRLFLNFYFLISVLWISSVQHTFILVLVISKKTHNQINILLFINSHPKTHFEKTWSILVKIYIKWFAFERSLKSLKVKTIKNWLQTLLCPSCQQTVNQKSLTKTSCESFSS